MWIVEIEPVPSVLGVKRGKIVNGVTVTVQRK